MASTGVAQHNGEAVSAWGVVATEEWDSLLPGWQAAVTASFVRQGLSSLRRRQLAPSTAEQPGPPTPGPRSWESSPSPGTRK